MLKGRTALVTGSTSGIGLGIAQRFDGEGTNIVLNGFGDAKEIDQCEAAFAAFLASDAAASITGAVLLIKGGWTAH